MDSANIIATLYACTDKAFKAAKHPANSELYLPPCKPFDVQRTVRETTPLEVVNDDQRPAICLTFDKPPKDPSYGYAFGLADTCDIRLFNSKHKAAPISQRHFGIFLNGTGDVLVRDTSTNGTAITYDGQASHELRRRFIWHIFPEFREVIIDCCGVIFKIVLPSHETCRDRYLANVKNFLPHPQSSIDQLALPLQAWGVGSNNITAAPTGQETPAERPIFVTTNPKSLGNGVSGNVYVCKNVSTAETFAAKEFNDDTWIREVSLLRRVSHKHIVRYVDFSDEPGKAPRLIMEYMPLGNLERQNELLPLTQKEVVTCLVQVLDATAFLHSCGIMHRDIKPANVLVASRAPLVVKLSDFGLGRDILGINTRMTDAGTDLYLAPEVLTGKYSFQADVWSIGVMMLEYLCGLPDTPISIGETNNWQWEVSEYVNRCVESELTSLLRDRMLRFFHEDRLTAGECHLIAQTIQTRMYIHADTALAGRCLNHTETRSTYSDSDADGEADDDDDGDDARTLRQPSLSRQNPDLQASHSDNDPSSNFERRSTASDNGEHESPGMEHDTTETTRSSKRRKLSPLDSSPSDSRLSNPSASEERVSVRGRQDSPLSAHNSRRNHEPSRRSDRTSSSYSSNWGVTYPSDLSQDFVPTDTVGTQHRWPSDDSFVIPSIEDLSNDTYRPSSAGSPYDEAEEPNPEHAQ